MVKRITFITLLLFAFGLQFSDAILDLFLGELSAEAAYCDSSLGDEDDGINYHFLNGHHNSSHFYHFETFERIEEEVEGDAAISGNQSITVIAHNYLCTVKTLGHSFNRVYYLLKPVPKRILFQVFRN